MSGTAGRTSGNTDPRKCAVRDLCLPYSFHGCSERRLAVTYALLADRSTNAGHAVLKGALGTVVCRLKDFLRLVSSQVDDIDRLMRRDPALRVRDLPHERKKLRRFSCRKTSADRVVCHRIEARLLLRNYALIDNLPGTFFRHRFCLHMKVEAAFFLHLRHILKERCL